jgi:hypothetical protein
VLGKVGITDDIVPESDVPRRILHALKHYPLYVW